MRRARTRWTWRRPWQRRRYVGGGREREGRCSAPGPTPAAAAARSQATAALSSAPLPPALRGIDVDAAVQQSVVGRLLPGFVAGLALLAGQPTLGATVLPGLVALLKRLHAYAAAAVTLRASLQASAARAYDADLLATVGPLLEPASAAGPGGVTAPAPATLDPAEVR